MDGKLSPPRFWTVPVSVWKGAEAIALGTVTDLLVGNWLLVVDSFDESLLRDLDAFLFLETLVNSAIFVCGHVSIYNFPQEKGRKGKEWTRVGILSSDFESARRKAFTNLVCGAVEAKILWLINLYQLLKKQKTCGKAGVITVSIVLRKQIEALRALLSKNVVI